MVNQKIAFYVFDFQFTSVFFYGKFGYKYKVVVSLPFLVVVVDQLT